MNPLNLPETTLRSWRPRHPAAGLERRLFAAEAGANLPTARWLWAGLAPAMAGVLLTLIVFNHENDELGTGPAMTHILGRQNSAAHVMDETQTAQNHLAAVTFEWTNQSNFNSSIRFTPPTNFCN
jgi:hypothetical protein